MSWKEWMRTAEIEPSIYAADFSCLGEQLEILLRGGVRIFQFDVGDGQFVAPITTGPIVLQSIAPIVHAAGGVVDCHLMIVEPQRHFAAFAEAGGDSVTVHYEVVGDRLKDVVAQARELLPPQMPIQVDGGIGPDTIRQAYDAGANLFVAGSSVFGREDIVRAYRRLVAALA